MKNKFENKQQGIVLLMVLGILALMSVLAVSFMQLTGLEKAISRNYVDRTRALMAAESGIEYALSRLDQMATTAGSTEVQAAMQFNGGDYTKPLDDLTAIPSFASPVNPMFSGFVGTGGGLNPERFRLKVVDESGRLNLNDSNGNWNIDQDAQDDTGDPEWVNAPGRLEMIVELLGDNLFSPGVGSAMVIQLFSPSSLGSRPNQLGGLFADMDAVRSQLVDTGVLSDTQFDEFRLHVTLNSWQDPNTIKPTFQLHIAGSTSSTFPYIGFDIYDFRDFQSRDYMLEARSPINVNTASLELLSALLGPEDHSWGVQGWFLREGPGERVSDGRYGNYLHTYLNYDDTDANAFGGDIRQGYGWEFGKNNILGMARHSPLIEDPVGLAKAIWSRVHLDDPATAVANDGKAFSTWEEFDYFLRHQIDKALIYPAAGYTDWFDNTQEGRSVSLPSARVTTTAYPLVALMRAFLPVYNGIGSDDFRFDFSGLSHAEQWWTNYMYDVQIDALLANFDPNTRSMEYTPNKTIHRKVDKNHLLRNTAELSFHSTGVYEIESMGLIYDSNLATSTMLAKAGIRCSIQVFELLRHTTQQQFLGMSSIDSNNLVDLEFDPDSAPLSPPLSGLFRESPDSTLTAGADLFKDQYGFDHNGFTVQSYPEPLKIDPDDLLNIMTSEFSPYDGDLMLATLQPEYGGATFHHHYNGSLKPWVKFLNAGDGGTSNIYTYGAESDSPINRNMPTESRLMNSVLSTGYPGNLYPDGGFSSMGRALTMDINNIGDAKGAVGSLTMWVKPEFDPAVTSRVQRIATFHGEAEDPSALGLAMYNKQFSIFYFCHDVDTTTYTALNVPDSELGTDPHILETNIFPLGELSSGDAVKWGWEDESLNSPPMGSITKFDFANPGWIPTRCFGVGWGGVNNEAQGMEMMMRNLCGRWTTTANHDWPGHSAHGNQLTEMYNFEGHCWNHVAVSWDIPKFRNDATAVALPGSFFPGKPSFGWFRQDALTMYGEDDNSPIHIREKLQFAVNGQWINNTDLDYSTIAGALDPNNPPEFFEANYGMHPAASGVDLKAYSLDLTPGVDEINRFLRLGECGIDESTGWKMMEAYSADAVYDDVISTDVMLDSQVMILPWLEGRYYNQESSRAYFTSPEINIQSILNLSRHDLLRIRGVQWNVSMPTVGRVGNRIEANFPGDNVNLFYDTHAGDPMEDYWNEGAAAGQHWDPISVDVSITDTGADPKFVWTEAAPNLDGAKMSMPALASGSDVWEMAKETEASSFGSYKIDLKSLAGFDGNQSFRYRIYFNYDDAANMPFYEVPVLHDITFTFSLLKPRILSWNVVTTFS